MHGSDNDEKCTISFFLLQHIGSTALSLNASICYTDGSKYRMHLVDFSRVVYGGSPRLGDGMALGWWHDYSCQKEYFLCSDVPPTFESHTFSDFQVTFIHSLIKFWTISVQIHPHYLSAFDLDFEYHGSGPKKVVKVREIILKNEACFEKTISFYWEIVSRIVSKVRRKMCWVLEFLSSKLGP